MPIPTLDYESWSQAGFVWNDPTPKKPYGYWSAPPGADKPGLSAVGSHVYSQHPSTEVLTASYDLCDGRGIRRWRPGQPLPLDLFAHVARPGATLESHKAMFEFEMWNNVCVPKYGWPPLAPHVQRCSMATANVDQYPGALANLGAVLGLSKQKDPEGDRLIKRLCVPQQPTKKDPRLRVPPPTDAMLAEAVAYIDANGLTSGRQAAGLPLDLQDAIEFEFLYRYCDRDVATEMEAAERMAPMTPAELGFWLIDQEVNARGLAIDRPGLRACIVILEQVLAKYGEECHQLTGLNVTQLEKLKGWLGAYGLNMASLDAQSIEAALARDDLHPSARRVLELRALTGSASVKKTFAIENQCSDDNRLRNLIVHHGARTGRPTGEGPQPLNLPKAGPQLVSCEACYKPMLPEALDCPWCGTRFYNVEQQSPKWKPEYVDDVLEIMSCGSLEMVERFFGDAMLCISGCLRGLFVAGPGNELIASDYTAIEAVVIAQLAGETWRNEAFERKDPIYLVGASKIIGTPVEQYLAYAEAHGEHHKDRALGKISELSCFTRQTQVLTKRGYIAIADVQLDDKLWDGVEWVSHRGVVAKGTAGTVRLDGVEMTPNHLINLNGSWRAAGLLVSSPRLTRLALATGSANLPSCGLFHPKKPSYNARAGRTRISLRRPIYAKGVARVARRADANRQGLTRSSITGMRTYWPMTSIADVCSTESPPASLAVNRAAPLRATETTRDGESGYTNRGGTERLVAGRSSPILSHCPAGTYRRLSSTVSKRTVTTSPATYNSVPAKLIYKTNGQSSKCKNASIPSRRSSSCTKEVFDIAHAGPRNRFTIKTDTGHLLVHNCGFGGWIGAWRRMEEKEGAPPDRYSDDDIKGHILAWRAASPAIVEMWGGQWRGLPWDTTNGYAELFGYEGCFIAAIRSPGTVYDFRGVTFQLVENDGYGRRLLVTLLSGRQLTYHDPRLRPSTRQWAAPGAVEISFLTWNTNPQYGPRGWIWMETYGPKIAENVTQATAHDIQRHGIILLRLHGYPLVLGVYDEDVVEVPIGYGSVEDVERLMSTMPPWAKGWAVRASGGYRAKRFRKA